MDESLSGRTRPFSILPLWKHLLVSSVLYALLLAAGCSSDYGETAENKGAGGPRKAWRVLGPGGGGAMFLPTVNPEDPDHVLLRCDMTGA